MNSSTQVGARTPVIANVDVLVFGAGSSAVAAALEAKARGATVFVVSDRSYFGEESAGALELWPERGEKAEPLFDAMFPPGATSPSYPGFIKRALEQSLLKAKIPFLFLARPVALLEDESGTAGVVLASRTSLYTIRCRSVVDASRHGLVLQLAGRAFPGKRPLTKSATLVSLAQEMPKPWVDRSELLKPAIDLKNDKGEPIDIRSLRLNFGTPKLENDSVRAWAGVEHHLRAQLTDNRFHLSADIVPLPPQRVLAEESQWTDDPLAALDKWTVSSDGIVPCNGTLPLTAKGVASLEQPSLQLAAGRKAGALAADYSLSHRNQTKGKLRIKTGSDTVTGTNTEKFGFAAPFVRDTNGEWLDLDFTAFPDLGSCDVAVAGGGTGGAAAGISSARQGARTIVLEMQQGLGGVGTLGLIASYWFGNRVGFCREIMDGLQALDPRAPGKQHYWNTELKMNWYHRALQDAGGEAWLRSFAFGVVQEGTRVTGLLVSTPYGMGLLRTGAVVDATGNADIAAAAGAPCRVIDGAHVGVQGTRLSPRKPSDHYRNSDHTFIDDCDATGVTHGFVNARAKFTTEFDVAPIVNSRERRQIIGEIELSPLDFLANRTFPDTINTASSNFDTHGFTIHPVFMVTPPDKKNIFAHVPFRCLLPQNVEGVLVTGLGISAHRDAIPVVRMQADVENQGFAAGLASAVAVAEKKIVRELDLRNIQRLLVEKKVLAPEVVTHEESFPLNSNLLRDAVEAGPEKVFNAAVLFAHPREVRPLLLEQLAKETDPQKKLNAALVLGLMGDKEAAPLLAETVKQATWDEGWNYIGMGQFGRSMSPLDAQIIALARTESPLAVAPILEKIKQLKPDPELSHCRAVAVAAALLANEEISFALAALLALPGLRGHAHLDTAEVVQNANDDWTENDARTKSLRELHLARGLYLGGDVKGIGQEILETYTNDLRGHYVRHARGILTAPDKRALARAGA